MNRPRPALLRIVGCLAATAVFVTGCMSNTADGPTGSSASSSTGPIPSMTDASQSSSSPLPSPETNIATAEPSNLSSSRESLDPAAQEVSDRAAVEQAWARFWEVTDNLPTVPETERRYAASSVAVEPTLTQVLDQAKSLADNGLVVYGRSVSTPIGSNRLMENQPQ
jgi:hypothetical protein